MKTFRLTKKGKYIDKCVWSEKKKGKNDYEYIWVNVNTKIWTGICKNNMNTNIYHTLEVTFGREGHSLCFPAGSMRPSISPSLTIVFLSCVDFLTIGSLYFFRFIASMDKKKLVKKLQDFG